jgi:hypothetical protein
VSGETCFLEVISEDMEHEEGLQHLYTQLSRKMGASGECIAFNETQRAALKGIQDKKAETISRLAKDKMKIIRDLQDLQLQLQNQWGARQVPGSHPQLCC